jgi:hypothetical protein
VAAVDDNLALSPDEAALPDVPAATATAAGRPSAPGVGAVILDAAAAWQSFLALVHPAGHPEDD